MICASAVTYYWPETPLEIDLTVGKEQQISIPDADVLHLGIPRDIRQKLKVQIVGSHIWLTAKEEFIPARVILLAEPVGRLVLQIRASYSDHFNQPIVVEAQVAESSAVSLLKDQS